MRADARSLSLSEPITVNGNGVLWGNGARVIVMCAHACVWTRCTVQLKHIPLSVIPLQMFIQFKTLKNALHRPGLSNVS